MELANTAVRDLPDAKVRNAMADQQRLEELAHERYRKEVEASQQAAADESA